MRYSYRQKNQLTFYDIGGDVKFRKIWSEYYADVMGCIYVIDASNPDRFEESREALHAMATHDYMVGKPLLILLNRPGTMSVPEISEKLQLSKLIEDRFGFGPKQAFVCIRQSNLQDQDLQESK
jgi:signal recognition particle receptor subunit beta